MSKESFQVKFEKDQKNKMLYALAIDTVGYFSYLIPGIAEISDIFWAPLAAILVFMLYRIRPKLALIGAIGILVEEFTPFIDFIPTAVLLWLLIYVIEKKYTLELYRLSEEDDLTIIEDE